VPVELLLNSVLNLTKEEIDNSKIEFNMQAGSGGQPFLDRWLKHSDAEKIAGTCTDCSYWGWYGKQRNFYPGQWVFSFARMTDDEWLLISAAEIIEVRPFLSDKYDITKHPQYKYLSDYDKRNAFDIEKYRSWKLVIKPEEKFDLYDVGEIQADENKIDMEENV